MTDPMVSAANSELSRRWRLIALFTLFAIVAFSRFKFWQCSFWEWDEILFANALHRFDVWAHSPHPPGYPGYVALTRGLNYFLHSDLKSLVFTNVFFGSLLVFPLYSLYRYFVPHRVALGATALSLFNLLVWYYSETGFSDVTSLFWVITSLALLYRYENNRSFYLGMFNMGIALSIRPQNLAFGILLVPLLLWLKIRRGDIKSAGIGLGLLVGVCVIWFVPLALSAGSLPSYMQLLRVHGENTAGQDQGYLALRHKMSLIAFIKIKFFLMWGSYHFGLLIAGLTILGVVVFLWRGYGKEFILLMLCFLPPVLLDFLWMHLYYPKYNIPTVVLISLFTAYGLAGLWPRYSLWERFLFPALVLGLILFSVHWTLPIIQHLHTTNSPPVQLFTYIRQHLNPKTDAILFDLRIKPLPPYYLPEFITIPRYDLTESKVEAIRNMNWYYIGPTEPGIVYQTMFQLDNEHMRRLCLMFPEVGLAKMEVVYGNGFDLKKVGDVVYRRLLESEAHCYLRNTGRAKILFLESGLLPPGLHAVPVDLELDGQSLLDTTVLPHSRLDRFFLLPEPRAGARPFSVLTFKTFPPGPEDALVVDDIGWWDVAPAPVLHTQVIEFNPEDKPRMLSGWSDPEADGEIIFAWSDGPSSVLDMPVRPGGIYEITFRARPVIRKEASIARQVLIVCLGEACSSKVELVDGAWRTYTRLVLSPAAGADEDVKLTFKYRFTYSPTLTNGIRDSRALGVAFDYVKLTRLGDRVVENSPPAVK